MGVAVFSYAVSPLFAFIRAFVPPTCFIYNAMPDYQPKHRCLFLLRSQKQVVVIVNDNMGN